MKRTDELRDPDGAARKLAKDILDKLEQYADIVMPADSEQPILHPAVRTALGDWLVEINHAPLLRQVKCKPRTTALLYGEPGCGKTTFARHLAARLALPCVCIRSESLQSKWVNQSGEQIGELFQLLKKLGRNAVAFVDEIDAIGAKREGSRGGREDAKGLNVILREIEKFDGVFIAATNRRDILDPALLRRFHMQIEINLPGAEERFAILKRYAEPFLPSDEDLSLLTSLTEGASPALLQQLMEGVKRQIVIAPKIGRDVAHATDVYARVLVGVQPPTETKSAPRLWTDAGALDELSDLSWPMARAA